MTPETEARLLAALEEIHQTLRNVERHLEFLAGAEERVSRRQKEINQSTRRNF